jgi:hypothetical protein
MCLILAPFNPGLSFPGPLGRKTDAKQIRRSYGSKETVTIWLIAQRELRFDSDSLCRQTRAAGKLL